MTDKELDKEILKYFWPHPFSGSGKPVYVAIIGEDDKVFQISWHVFNTAIKSLITKARINELELFDIDDSAYRKRRISELKQQVKEGECYPSYMTEDMLEEALQQLAKTYGKDDKWVKDIIKEVYGGGVMWNRQVAANIYSKIYTELIKGRETT